jgi:hypothetical protein
MQRRNFLKTVGSSGLLTLVSPKTIAQALVEASSGVELENAFRNPPMTARAYTWWHWMNGNVTKEGITLDLEAMKKAGLGGFQLFEAGSGIPKGPVESLSKEWLELMRHTIEESDRLGLEFAMHNCPGWSSSGGPWITPELSMQQMTWSELHIAGNQKLTVQLPKPLSKLNYYQDALVLAFPSLKGEGMAISKQLKRITSPQGEVQPETVIGLKPDGFDVQIPNEAKSTYLLFEFEAPVEIQSLTLATSATGGGGDLILEYSNDGSSFQKICTIHGGGGGWGSKGDEVTSVSFQNVRAKYYRLFANGSRHFSYIWFSGAPRFSNWMKKANYRGSGSQPEKGTANLSQEYTIDPKQVVNLTEYMDANGVLTWQAPTGDWTILRIGHSAVGQLNHSAPTAGTGLDCDKFSVAAFDFHFNQMFKNLMPFLEPLARKGKVGLLIDSYEMGMQNWTATLPKEFANRRGYDITSYLPAMTGRVVKDTDTTERYLFDLRRTHADLIRDNYYGRFDTLCKQHGIITYTEPYEGGPFVEMEIGKKLDINMGEFWSGITVLWPNYSLRRTIKLASSIAHIQGEKVVGAEAYTAEPGAGKWQQYPYSMKAIGDWAYTKGLTRFIFHRFAHQPHPTALPGMTMGPWGIHFDRTNTWWDQGAAWLQYIARTQSLLQQGTFVADIAYFNGEEVPVRSLNESELRPALPEGYDYDLIDRDTLLNKVKISNARLQVKGGPAYAVLVLPDKEEMSLELALKLQDLVEQGLILVGLPPKRTLGLGKEDEEQKLQQVVEKIWGGKNGERGLRKGKVYQGTSLEVVLKDKGLAPDFEYTATNAGAAINYIHRKTGDTDIYFIANRRRRSETIIGTFRSNLQPELWNSVDNTISPVPVYEVVNGRTQIPLHLDPAGSVFVVFRSKQATPGWSQVSKEGKPILSLKSSALAPATADTQAVNNFSIAFWVKPEVDIALTGEELFGPQRTDHYALFPSLSEAFATTGAAVGRNGVMIYERQGEEFVDVLSVPVAISGWTHFVLQYQNGIPIVHLNGTKIKAGNASGKKVLPSNGETSQKEGASFYNGEMSQPVLYTKVLNETAIASLFQQGKPKVVPPIVSFGKGKKPELLFWQNGHYQLHGNANNAKSIYIKALPNPIELAGPWKVSFPEGKGAPSQISLKTLHSLHIHPEPGVKYFSGTASYQMSFNAPALSLPNQRLYLDLGQVEVIATIILNGKELGILWKPPFYLDVTDAMRVGENKLEVRVTNLWPNRLIGDEQLPAENEYSKADFPGKFAKLFAGGIKALPDWYIAGKPKPAGGRITFTTWKHYQKDDPLLESGLIGPVVIRTAQGYVV